MYPLWWIDATALGLLALALLAELLHAWRAKRLGRLAFGLPGRPRAWTKTVPFLRAFSVAAIGWALLTLTILDPKEYKGDEGVSESKFHRVLIVMDASPSMSLRDAGPQGDLTRRERAYDVLQSVLQRIVAEQARFSVIAVYNGAQPVVVDTTDLNVIRNILNDLPLDYAFPHGKTKLEAGLNEAAELAKRWPKKSVTMIVVADGDTVPDEGLSEMPPSIDQVMLVGVGNPRGGIFIDGHQSRQDASALRAIARRIDGRYYDANEKHLPSDSLKALSEVIPMENREGWDRRMVALVLLAVAGVLIALLPILLEYFGAPARHLRYFSTT
ncbi:MAG: vWA domain-containing protein [Candidatus Sumerlaeota bacterium]